MPANIEGEAERYLLFGLYLGGVPLLHLTLVNGERRD
jgi:hypothetical protein